MENTSWISLIISTLLPFATGFVWYHHSIFGFKLVKTSGEMKIKINRFVSLALALFFSFLLSFFLLNFNNETGQEGIHDNFLHGMWHGAFVAVFIIVPVLFVNRVFESKKWSFLLNNIGYWLLTLSLMGGVVDAMNHWAPVN